MGGKAQAIDILEVSRTPDKFLKAILDGLNYDGYRFTADGNDGCMGSCCISKAQVISIPGSAKQAALHLNFTVAPGAYTNKVAPPYRASFNLAVTHFHLTARPKAGQALINAAGPSILTAEESIHINRNGDWGREANITRLAGTLGVTEVVLLNTLRNVEGLTTNYMQTASIRIKDSIKNIAGVNGGLCLITWTGSDSTFN